jgi:hypothetical protein
VSPKRRVIFNIYAFTFSSFTDFQTKPEKQTILQIILSFNNLISFYYSTTLSIKKNHAFRNEARRLTRICLTAAHTRIHGTILLFYFLHNPTLHVTSYRVKM